jgi:membrane protein
MTFLHRRTRGGDLSRRDWLAILTRAGKKSLDDNVPMIASALAYSSFLAIPSTLLVATGLFTLVAGPDTIGNLMQHLGQIAPKETVTLLNDSLQRLNDHPATGIVITLVGFVIALWATTGAMNSFMMGLNIAYDRKDSRNFVKKRIVGLQMTVCIGVAFLLTFGLLVLGPELSKWIGNAIGASGVVTTIWWPRSGRS